MFRYNLGIFSDGNKKKKTIKEHIFSKQLKIVLFLLFFEFTIYFERSTGKILNIYIPLYHQWCNFENPNLCRENTLITVELAGPIFMIFMGIGHKERTTRKSLRRRKIS